MRAFKLLGALQALLFLWGLAGWAGAETFTTTDEKVVEATIIGIEDEVVTMKLQNGRVIEAPLSRFAPESVEKIQVLGNLIPRIPETSYELTERYLVSSRSYFERNEAPEIAVIQKETYDVVFLDEEMGVKIYFKQEGRRISDPMLIIHEVYGEDEGRAMAMKQAAHLPPTEREPDKMTYRMQMEDESSLQILCEVLDDGIRFTSLPLKNVGITRDELVILAPGIAARSNDGGDGFFAGNNRGAPWDEVAEFIRAHEAVFALEGLKETRRFGFLEEAKIPAKMEQVAFGGPGLCNHLVLLESAGNSYLHTEFREEVTLPNLWEGFELRHSRSAIDAAPKAESLMVRILKIEPKG